MKHLIRQFRLEQGALEIQYLEDYFDEFREKKTAEEIVDRLSGREHLILLSMAESPDGEHQLIPVAFKVGHELRAAETDPDLVDLVEQLQGSVELEGRKIFYSWLGGTRQPWRGQGHYRALTEQQEEWALANGYQELVVKTKNKFYTMRAALDHLRFNVVRFQQVPADNGESKVYLSKLIGAELLRHHQTERTLVESV
jgi:GNAT superfamily N-acetyltransferase